MKREQAWETQSEGHQTWVSQIELPSKKEMPSKSLKSRFNKTQLFFSQTICLNNAESFELVIKLEEI